MKRTIALLVLAMTPHLASAKEFHVSVNGDDSNKGSTSKPFKTISGAARVERSGKKVASLGPGAFFGDLALLDRAPRNASVIAESPMELAKVNQKAFDALLDVPGFSKKLLAGLARRLRQEDAKTR